MRWAYLRNVTDRGRSMSVSLRVVDIIITSIPYDTNLKTVL